MIYCNRKKHYLLKTSALKYNFQYSDNVYVRILTIFVLLTSLSIPLKATIHYVSHTGSNTKPYTSWETAADSIMSAINISEFGDTIYVAKGVYKERIDMIPGLTLLGSGMDSCVIDTREFNDINQLYSVKMVDSCYVSGFNIFTYSVDKGDGFYIREDAGMTINAQIISNKIQEAAYGINFSGFNLTNSRSIVSKNWVLNVNNGIHCMLNKPIISENIIYAKEVGLISQIYSSPTYLNNIVIIDGEQAISGFGGSSDILSILKDNTFIAYDVGSIGYGMNTYSDTIINNIISGVWNYGIFTAGSIVKNNHIGKVRTGLRYDSGSGGSPPVVQYNNFWNNGNNFQNYTANGTNIYSDPMFVNEDSLDFHLQMYSPLIDAGDPNILDKDGSRSDIGLYGGPYGENYKYLDLAPRQPVNLTAVLDTNRAFISWNRNTESDFNNYKIYRDTVSGFLIDSTSLISVQSDTFFLQVIPPGIGSLYYRLTAVDNQGNESIPSEELAVIITSVNDHPTTVNDYYLYQNYPNPFNPSTKIGYRLKERGYVKLYVYDIKGELVSVLVNQSKEAGYHEVEFPGSVQHPASSIQQLASGIYIYQLMIKNENNIPVFNDIRKMIYLK